MKITHIQWPLSTNPMKLGSVQFFTFRKRLDIIIYNSWRRCDDILWGICIIYIKNVWPINQSNLIKLIYKHNLIINTRYFYYYYYTPCKYLFLSKGPGENLFNFMADKLKEFMIDHELLGHRYIGTQVYWDTGILGHRHTGTQVYWDTGLLGHR